MKQWKPQDLLQMSAAYWAACTLHTAVHLGVFSALYEGPLRMADIARATACDLRGIDLLCTALCSVGLMQRTDDQCALTPFARQYLCHQSAEYMGHIIEHQRHLLPAWQKLDEAVRHGVPVRSNSASTQNSDEERETFLMGMNNVAQAQAVLLAQRIDLSGQAHLLDLGGGPATYAVRFCQHNAQLRATVFDLPTTEPIAAKMIAAHGLADRIAFVGGNFMQDALPTGCDVVWISQILHAFGPDECRVLLAHVMEYAAPGAVILIQEFMVDDSRNGPEFPALFGLNMLVGTAHGQSYTRAELAAMLADVGAINITCPELHLPQNCGILRAVKA